MSAWGIATKEEIKAGFASPGIAFTANFINIGTKFFSAR